ncbi:MAG: glycosyl hydrolase family 28 protein [Bacteroidota bacterium]
MKNIIIIGLVVLGIHFQGCETKITSENNSNALLISQSELIVYKAPDEAPANTTYSVFVRYDGGEWIDLHEYNAEVDGGYLKEPIHHMAFVTFDSDFSKRIDVKVIKNSGTINDVKIRPAIKGIKPTVKGDSILFSITSPQKLSVEVNGDLHNNLMVFANPLETEQPDPKDPNVIYYGPGVHKIGGDGQGTLHLESNNHVYIAGGAIVYGTLSAFGAQNVSITGRGILSGSMYTDHAYPHPGGKGLIGFLGVHNSKIEGIILLNTVTWNIHLYGCDNITCSNLKIMGWTINSDGINPQCASNIMIDDCFIRSYDDCISIKMNYGAGEWYSSRTDKNITVQNCIFWTDQGRSILIGPESYSPKEAVFEDITIKNIDILYNKNYDVDWAKGALAINLGDGAIARNITFEDIRVDQLGEKSNLICLTMDKYTYNVSEGKLMENIRFNNITLNSEQNFKNFIYGLSDSNMIRDIQFNNLKINGEEIKDAGQGWFEVNEFTENITFK